MKLGVMKDSARRRASPTPTASSATPRTWVGMHAAALAPRWARRCSTSDDIGALVEAIAREARTGDHVLVMSNGGFGGIHEKLLARLARP